MVIELASTISANADELPDEDEVEDEPLLPRPPAVLEAPLPDAPDPPEPEPDELLLAEPVEPAETVSPVVSVLSETIVPVAGA
jgi:hypothetical protein